MKLEINATTFIKTGENAHGYDVGTVEVNGVAQKAVRTKYGINVHGFVGRYKTSGKAWPATVSLSERGLYVFFGRDDRSGRFNKRNAISFEPALFDTLTNQKYWEKA